MKSNPNLDTQKDEIEILSNILFEQFEIKNEEPHFEFEIKIVADTTDEPKIKMIFTVTFTDDYPNSMPKFDILDKTHYVSSKEITGLKEKIIKYHSEESCGMPIIYQAYEMIKVFFVNKIGIRK
jgi:hypothetical protein